MAGFTGRKIWQDETFDFAVAYLNVSSQCIRAWQFRILYGALKPVLLDIFYLRHQELEGSDLTLVIPRLHAVGSKKAAFVLHHSRLLPN